MHDRHFMTDAFTSNPTSLLHLHALEYLLNGDAEGREVARASSTPALGLSERGWGSDQPQSCGFTPSHCMRCHCVNLHVRSRVSATSPWCTACPCPLCRRTTVSEGEVEVSVGLGRVA